MDDYAERISEYMKVVVFSGTTEGRMLSHALAKLDVPVLVCVATEYGRLDQGVCPGVEVHAGRLEEKDMVQLLQGKNLCIDATHPYATQVTANIRRAAEQAGVLYKRLLRPASPLPPGCLEVKDVQEVVNFLEKQEGNVLLTTGAKELAGFMPLGTQRLFARVLPLESSLEACKRANIPTSHIIAMQGPYSKELNIALMHQFSIGYLVTKDGGNPGGFTEKLEAAKECQVQAIVIRRPADQGASYEEVLNFCKEWITQCG